MQERFLSEMIGRSVDHFGEHAALVAADRTVTYADLWAQTGALAVHLRALGLVDGAVVALSLEDAASAVITMVAAGRAGLTYLPIDVHLPEHRSADLLQTANAEVLVVDHDRSPAGVPVLDLRSQPVESLPHGQPTWLPPERAYLMATSGSSGAPKIVAIGQKGLITLVRAWSEVYGLHPGQRFLQMASTAFDVFTGDWMRALVCGGTLHLCPVDVYTDPSQLWAYLERSAIQFAEFVPVNLRRLVRYCVDTGRTLDSFEVLVCGSDLWFAHELAATRRLLPTDARLIASYGTTETTIDNLWWEPTAHDIARLDPDLVVPLGGPLPGCAVQVIDHDGRLLHGPGTGTLLIGGDLVGLGYLGPDAPGDRFRTIPDQDPDRWFVTGDIVSRDHDGTLHLRGRADRQLKVNGRRVDLGEIEAAARACPAVVEAAVGTAGAAPDVRIVADVVLVNGPALDGDGCDVVHRFLADRLPAHLIPEVRQVTKILTTANGKVDRRSFAVDTGGTR